MTPALLNIYFNATVTRWCSQRLFCINMRELVGDPTAKSRFLRVQVNESQFTDNLALYDVTHAAFEALSKKFVQMANFYGLTISLPKTKGW